jgi:hypothetical protein
MEVRVFGSFDGPIAGRRDSDDIWSHPALPGLVISVGLLGHADGPHQPFVSINTEGLGGARYPNAFHDADGNPIMMVELGDAELYNVKPTDEPPSVLYETTLVVAHYAKSDEEARQLSHRVGELLFQREDVVVVTGESQPERAA